jgi:hypothetical protein
MKYTMLSSSVVSSITLLSGVIFLETCFNHR